MQIFLDKVILTVLMLTENKPICNIDEIIEYTFLSFDHVMDYLKRLMELGFIDFIDFDGILSIKVKDRLKLAYYAIGLGIDVKRVSKFLNWREFENLCFEVLKTFDYSVYKNVRFKIDSKRFELDLIGFKIPYVICLDCKHWSINRPSIIERAIKLHNDKTLLFSKVFRSLFNLDFNGKIYFIPVIVTLLDESSGIYNGLPVVSIFKFNSFLNELPYGIGYIRLLEA
ncbi:MAG: hypothetical protein QXO74_01570 [Candidatus Methanomethylicia archaeon]